MEDSEPWCFTIVRTNGLRLMRPEKSWRPIITVEVDNHHSHETVLGVDGQNPNLKEMFLLQQAHVGSRLDIRVWHRSQSKKKAKKRNLVASASHSLGELMKKQEKEPHSIIEEVEIRLQCQTPAKRAVASRGKPQSGATLLLRIHPPRDAIQIACDDGEETQPLIDSPLESGSGSECSSSSTGELTAPGSPTKDSWPDEDTFTELPVLRRRRRRRPHGYSINSDDEACSSDSFYEDEAEKPFIDNNSYYSEDDTAGYNDDPNAIRTLPEGAISIRISDGGESSGWALPIFPSLLPQYTERIEVPPEMTLMERVLSTFTMYSELRSATLDSQYEKVFSRLQMEWTYIGGLLVAMAAVSTAVFGIAPGTIFTVHSYARNAVAASSASSGLGIAVDSWFLLRYNWADLHTFINRARDLYGSYFFFALSARVPALCFFVSALSLMFFLGLVAFAVWPMGVLVTCFVVGLLMTLQFLVFGAHWCVLRVVAGARRTVRGVARVLGKGKEANKVEVGIGVPTKEAVAGKP